jgi:hypothetical protein
MSEIENSETTTYLISELITHLSTFLRRSMNRSLSGPLLTGSGSFHSESMRIFL